MGIGSLQSLIIIICCANVTIAQGEGECLLSSADRGQLYRGHIEKTASGRACQEWSAQFPHKHDRIPENFPEHDLVGSYCRNPDNTPGPWCYTTDPEVRWELCDVPLCPGEGECLLSSADHGQLYRGHIHKTASGRACQEWSAQFPHKHDRIPENFPEHDLVGSYCRNPDNTPGPWCYTTDPEVRWELCDVPLCPDYSSEATTAGLDFCSEAVCPKLPSQPGMGRLQCTNEERIGSVCRFTCIPRHLLIGDDVIQCVASGDDCSSASWDGEVPKCRALFCPDLPAIQHGRFSCTRNFKLGSFCSYECDEGAVMDPPEHDGRLCYKNATWIGEDEPLCYVPGEGECLLSSADRGQLYRGHIEKTASGRACQEWSAQFPHKHDRIPENFLEHDLVGSYCRNPDNTPGPWCYTTDPGVRWELCDVPLCPEQCVPLRATGDTYRGRISKTKDGIKCQKWEEQRPHSHNTTSQRFPNADLVINYCRNPSHDLYPWCYTVDPSVRWQYCDIPSCPDQCLLNAFDIGKNYRGRHATTKSGRSCQEWTSQTPHQHSRTPERFPDEGLESNFCRNPDNEPGIWCYTTDADVRWEYCDVPTC